jgi:hypothetical protein
MSDLPWYPLSFNGQTRWEEKVTGAVVCCEPWLSSVDHILPALDRAERIGEFLSYPQSRTYAELLIDCEEDWTLQAVPVGMLREDER